MQRNRLFGLSRHGGVAAASSTTLASLRRFSSDNKKKKYNLSNDFFKPVEEVQPDLDDLPYLARNALKKTHRQIGHLSDEDRVKGEEQMIKQFTEQGGDAETARRVFKNKTSGM